MPPSEIHDYFGNPAYHVDERHWQSGFPVPFRELESQGIDVVVLSALEAQPDPGSIAFVRERSPNLRIIAAPYVDTEDPRALPRILHIANGVADRVVERLAEGKRVLITCAAGRNRSGLISALVLMKRRGLSGKEAADLLRGVRADALTNRTFLAHLESLPSPQLRQTAI